MSCEQETLRVILQNKFDRIENLVQMNHAATLAVPTILAAIWGISIKENGFDTIPILCLISIGLLLIWRYFTHYLDDDIAKTYVQIAQIEEELEVFDNSPSLSIYEKIVDALTKFDKCKKQPDSLNVILKEIPSKEKLRFFECLYNKKMMGFRGHNKWDKIAFISISLFTMLVIFYWLPTAIYLISPFYHLTVILNFGTAFFGGLVVTLVIYILFQKYTPIQKDPCPEDLRKIIFSIIR